MDVSFSDLSAKGRGNLNTHCLSNPPFGISRNHYDQCTEADRTTGYFQCCLYADRKNKPCVCARSFLYGAGIRLCRFCSKEGIIGYENGGAGDRCIRVGYNDLLWELRHLHKLYVLRRRKRGSNLPVTAFFYPSNGGILFFYNYLSWSVPDDLPDSRILMIV